MAKAIPLLAFTTALILGPVTAQCDLEVDLECYVSRLFEFDCKKSRPITSLTVIWNGVQPVDVQDPHGTIYSNIFRGNEVTFSTEGFDKDFEVQLFASGTHSTIGFSMFNLKCNDKDMNDPEDCGNNVGGLKNSGVEDWIFEGMSGEGGNFLDCTTTFTDACTIPGPPEDFEVTYFYSVLNRGSDPLWDIALDDDKLGLVGGPIDLQPGEMLTFTRTTQITETTTNTVFAMGVSATGENCIEDDSVTVDVSPT